MFFFFKKGIFKLLRQSFSNNIWDVSEYDIAKIDTRKRQAYSQKVKEKRQSYLFKLNKRKLEKEQRKIEESNKELLAKNNKKIKDLEEEYKKTELEYNKQHEDILQGIYRLDSLIKKENEDIKERDEDIKERSQEISNNIERNIDRLEIEYKNSQVPITSNQEKEVDLSEQRRKQVYREEENQSKDIPIIRYNDRKDEYYTETINREDQQSENKRKEEKHKDSRIYQEQLDYYKKELKHTLSRLNNAKKEKELDILEYKNKSINFNIKKLSKRKVNYNWGIIYKILIYFIIAGVIGLGVLLFGIFYFSFGLPAVPEFKKFYGNRNVSYVLAENNKNNAKKKFVLLNKYGEKKVHHRLVNYNEIPKILIEALLSTEDRNFFQHYGVDIYGLIRAVIRNIKFKRFKEGGSTITQQLAKISFLKSDKKLKRKAQELLLALAIERKFSKKEIIELYLNTVYLGSGNYGIAQGSKGYFNKDVKDLNIIEAAMLVAMLKAPSKYSPKNNYELAMKRTKVVLFNMQQAGYITKKELKILNNNFKLVVRKKERKLNNNNYVSDWIYSIAKDHIAMPKNGAYGIFSTVDIDLQNYLSKIIKKVEKKYTKKLGGSQVAIIVMTPKGAIKASLGGRDYQKSAFNRAIFAQRQPASSFKLLVYLQAFRNGYQPDSIFIDQKVTIDKWSPKNYGNKYYGKVTLREAFTRSLNSVAVQLANILSIKDIIELARNMGISSDLENNISLALGTSEITLLELTTLYAHVANRGVAVYPYLIKTIKSEGNDIIFKKEKYNEKERVATVESVEYMRNLLYNVSIWGTGKKSKNKINKKVYAKTGTSQQYRDAWFVGFTDDIVVGVWIGNDNDKPTNKITGGSIPAVIWNDIVKYYYKLENSRVTKTKKKEKEKEKEKEIKN